MIRLGDNGMTESAHHIGRLTLILVTPESNLLAYILAVTSELDVELFLIADTACRMTDILEDRDAIRH